MIYFTTFTRLKRNFGSNIQLCQVLRRGGGVKEFGTQLCFRTAKPRTVCGY